MRSFARHSSLRSITRTVCASSQGNLPSRGSSSRRRYDAFLYLLLVPHAPPVGGKVVATERIYPAGDGAIAWIEVNTDNVGTNHYLRVDDPYGSYNDASSDAL